MTGVNGLAGDPVHAVLPPPQLRRFRQCVGIGEDEPLEVVVGGWHKHVLLTTDRAFLFPRHAAHVEGFEREVAAYAVLADGGVPLVPRLLDRWRDDEVHPYPFAAVTRLPGTHLDDPVHLFEQLGEAIAAWHELAPPPALAHHAPAPPADHDLPHQRWLHRALDPRHTHDAVEQAVERLAMVDQRRQWSDALEAAAALPHVLVHGDVHEDQLLAEGDTLTGVLDWETARIDHPFFDFDFGEWGTGLWRRHRPEFPTLWGRLWTAYADARGLDLPVEPLVTAFGVRQLLFEAARSRSAP